LAENRDLSPGAAPAGESFNNFGLEGPVQSVGHQPGLAVGEAHKFAGAKDGTAPGHGLDQRDIRFVEAAAIRKLNPNMHLGVTFKDLGHCMLLCGVAVC
jgi:hypothetical protein